MHFYAHHALFPLTCPSVDTHVDKVHGKCISLIKLIYCADV